MHMSIALNQPWPYLFTLQILLAIGSVCANSDTPEIPTLTDNDNEFDKREAKDWQQMMHPWSKREAKFDADISENGEVVPDQANFGNPYPYPYFENEDADLDDENILNEKRGFKKLRRNTAPYMKRDFEPSASAFSKRASKPITTSKWLRLKGMWGKRAETDQ